MKTHFFALSALAILGASPTNAQEEARCIQANTDRMDLRREALPFPGLDIRIGIAYEGFLQIGDKVFPSPTGDINGSAGPYDAEYNILYIWGYWTNGWINIDTGESDRIRPNLYDPPNDIEDVTGIRRSHALGMQFYSGWTGHRAWLIGPREYRVYKIEGRNLVRIRELEDNHLRYMGDDPLTNLAVFFPRSEGSYPDDLIWFDGERIVDPPRANWLLQKSCAVPE
ncbi:MAG: hypothetical protein AAF280_00485 [Pseudomonadota bacterium]